MSRSLEEVVHDAQQMMRCFARSVDALEQIAKLGGVQGEWAAVALRDMRAMVGETTLLESVK